MYVASIEDVVKKFAMGGVAKRAGDMLKVKELYQPAVPQGVGSRRGFVSLLCEHSHHPQNFARQEQTGLFCSLEATVHSLVVSSWLSHLSLLS